MNLETFERLSEGDRVIVTGEKSVYCGMVFKVSHTISHMLTATSIPKDVVFVYENKYGSGNAIGFDYTIVELLSDEFSSVSDEDLNSILIGGNYA